MTARPSPWRPHAIYPLARVRATPGSSVEWAARTHDRRVRVTVTDPEIGGFGSEIRPFKSAGGAHGGA